MARKTKKEPEKKKTSIAYLILSVFLIGLGIFNLKFPYIGMEDLLFFTSMIFLMYAAVTFLCYMWARKEGEYELLAITITSIVVALFMLIFKEGKVEVVLGTGVLAFFVGTISVRIKQLIFLKKKEDNLFLVKLTTSIVLTILTLLVVVNLYMGTTVQTFLYGYYFIVYGIICLLDTSLNKVIQTDKLKKYLNSSK